MPFILPQKLSSLRWRFTLDPTGEVYDASQTPQLAAERAHLTPSAPVGSASIIHHAPIKYESDLSKLILCS